jgi:hypothetical protein
MLVFIRMCVVGVDTYIAWGRALDCAALRGFNPFVSWHRRLRKMYGAVSSVCQ